MKSKIWPAPLVNPDGTETREGPFQRPPPAPRWIWRFTKRTTKGKSHAWLLGASTPLCGLHIAAADVATYGVKCDKCEDIIRRTCAAPIPPAKPSELPKARATSLPEPTKSGRGLIRCPNESAIIARLEELGLGDRIDALWKRYRANRPDLVGWYGPQNVVTARQHLWADLHDEGWSYPVLGRLFGRDQSTIRLGVNAFRRAAGVVSSEVA